MDVRGVFKPLSNKRFISLPCFFAISLVQINVQTPCQVQFAVDILFGYEAFNGAYVGNLKVCDFGRRFDSVSFDILWDIPV